MKRTSLGSWIVAMTLSMAAMLRPAVAADTTWPTIALPAGVQATSAGGQITRNGLPLRMQVFVTREPMEQLIAWFRESFGSRHVENQVGNALVIGRAEGDFYLSVQLTQTNNGTRGIIAVSRMKSLSSAVANGEPLVSKAPGDSRVLSDMTSEDGGRLARHLVYTNRHSADMNRELATEFLMSRGYKLEREVQLQDKPGQTLFFRDGQREAIVVIGRQGDEAAVVLNMISPGQKLEMLRNP